jgi:hypothetical protein
MIRIILKHTMIGWLFLLITAFCLTGLSTPSYSADKAVAKLTGFAGTVLIKSQGSWGVTPENDLLLYSNDRVVTKIGTATITFNDGAVIEIKANSNLLIRETEETGVSKQLGTVKRQLRLLLGKMLFKSGKGSGVNTTLETTTMVCGLRGTQGTLSIDAMGQTYLQFVEGWGDILGKYISGIASDVPGEIAALADLQQAAFVAAASAKKAKEAAEQLARGEITKEDAAKTTAAALIDAAKEIKTAAEAMLNSPDENIRREALEVIKEAEAVIKAVNEQLDIFLDGGDDDAVLGDSFGVLGDALTRLVNSLTPQGVEDEIPPITDILAPVVNLTTFPGSFDNSRDLIFGVSANESVTYFYRLDGGQMVEAASSDQNTLSITFSNISEGSHTLELFARDSFGNESQSVTYSWISDFTAPTVALSAAPGLSGTTTLTPKHTNSEPGTVTYILANVDSPQTPITGTGLTDGQYTIVVIATDQAGNMTLQPTVFPFMLKNQAFQGNAVGEGSIITGSATGAASIIYGMDWGGWNNSLNGSWSGTHTGDLSLKSGGVIGEDGYWISLTTGDINSSGVASGTNKLIMLTDTTLTMGEGLFNGAFNTNGTWTGSETGSGLRNLPLLMSGLAQSDSGFFNYSNENIGTGIFGKAGVAKDGDSYRYVLLGDYTNGQLGVAPSILLGSVIDPLQPPEQGAVALMPSIWENGAIDGFLASTYFWDSDDVDHAGIFYEKLSGNYYEGVHEVAEFSNGMWLSMGEIIPVEMASGVGLNFLDGQLPSQLNFQNITEGNMLINSSMGTSIPNTILNSDQTLNMVYGVWDMGMGGSYQSLPASGWTLSLRDENMGQLDEVMGWMEIGPGPTDSNSTWAANHLSASVAGSWVSLNDMVTGVLGGKLIGTFDPADSVWQAVAAGGFVDTKTFLAMAATDAGKAKLAQLDIPYFQVGETDLTQTSQSAYLSNVHMDNVKFFAYSTGAAPKIWATDSVGGNVAGGVVSPGEFVTLSGTGTGASINGSFTMNSYNTNAGTWDASIAGSGTVNTYNVSIDGDAAGKTSVNGTSFSGTASGVARQAGSQDVGF